MLPEVITSVCVFAPLAPHGAPGLDFTEGMSDGFREQIRVFIDAPGRARANFRARSAEFARLSSSPAWWMDRWADRAGKDAAHSQEKTDYLALVNRDGYAGGDESWWEDWSASFLPWGFDPASIQSPVALWHGLQDTAALPAHSRWLAARIPHFPADQDHTDIEENNRSAAIAWVRGHMEHNARQQQVTDQLLEYQRTARTGWQRAARRVWASSGVLPASALCAVLDAGI
jgi:pimeloyl-ACP methyl ester carboxylesterase